MDRRIVILGSGTTGTLTANRLRRHYDESDYRIIVVDKDDDHLYRPGLLSVPFGLTEPDHLLRPSSGQLTDGIGLRLAAVDRVDLDADTVHFADGTALGYDVLVVATGAAPLPEQPPGLTGPGWGESVHGLHDLPAATALRDALRRFDGGRLVVDVAGDPERSALAALEFCFLADRHFRRRGIREQVELTYLSPLNGTLGRPVIARALGQLLEEKWGKLIPGFATTRVDGEHGVLHAQDGRTRAFDLAVVLPPQGGAAYAERSPGLADDLGFVPVDRHTLQSKAKPNVFALGEATDLPVIQSGPAVHFQGEVLVHNLRRFLADEPLDASYDGRTTCFVDTGCGKALRIDSSYDSEPRPGRETRLNHLGTRVGQSFYWNVLLPGHDLPRVVGGRS